MLDENDDRGANALGLTECERDSIRAIARALIPNSDDLSIAGLLQQLKRLWLEHETSWRQRVGKPVTRPIAPWQIWSVAPEGVAPIVENATLREWEGRWLKIFDKNRSDISSVLRPRPGLIMSSDELHQEALCWVAPLTTSTRESNGPAIYDKDTRGRARFCDLPYLMAMDCEPESDRERGLLVWQSDLDGWRIQGARRLLLDLIEGKYADPAAPRPGAIVNLTLGHDISHAFVLASCKRLLNTPDLNPVICCKIFGVDEVGDGTTGVVRVKAGSFKRAANSQELAEEFVIDGGEVVAIPRRFAVELGHAESYVNAVREAVKGFVAQ